MPIYDYSVKKPDGSEQSLEAYRGKVVLIVNTASDCGFAPQYTDLERLYKTYKDEGFEILDFPCNQFAHQSPLTDIDNAQYCQLKYDVSFPIFAKIEVNGENTHPLYEYLKQAKTGILFSSIKWNFTKFLIDQNGEVVKRYSPQDLPKKIEVDIKVLLEQNALRQ